jgi:hypothetical protein
VGGWGTAKTVPNNIAEAARVAAETARDNAETARIAAENARIAAETARATAEAARIAAETGRGSAETARATAETARVAAENARIASETARIAAETARASASAASVSQANAARDQAIQAATIPAVGADNIVYRRSRSLALVNGFPGFKTGIPAVAPELYLVTAAYPLNDGSWPHSVAALKNTITLTFTPGASNSNYIGPRLLSTGTVWATGRKIIAGAWLRQTDWAAMNTFFEPYVRWLNNANAQLSIITGVFLTAAQLGVVGSTSSANGLTLTVVAVRNNDCYVTITASAPANAFGVQVFFRASNSPVGSVWRMAHPVLLADCDVLDPFTVYGDNATEVDLGVAAKALADNVILGAKSVVHIGMSITAGIFTGGPANPYWGQTVAANRGYSYTNKGVNGSTMAVVSGQNPMVSRFAADVTAFNPYECWIDAGTNDWGFNVPIGSSANLVDTTTFFAALYQCAIAHLNVRPANRLLLLTPTKRSEGVANGVGATMENYRQTIRDVATLLNNGAYKGRVTVIEMDTLTRATFDANPSYWDSSGFHPNQAGHNAIAQLVNNVF